MGYHILRKNGGIIYKGNYFEDVKKLVPENSGTENYSLLNMSLSGQLVNIEFANQVVKSSIWDKVYLGPCDWKSVPVPLEDLELLVKEAKKELMTTPKPKPKKNKIEEERPDGNMARGSVMINSVF